MQSRDLTSLLFIWNKYVCLQDVKYELKTFVPIDIFSPWHIMLDIALCVRLNASIMKETHKCLLSFVNTDGCIID